MFRSTPPPTPPPTILELGHKVCSVTHMVRSILWVNFVNWNVIVFCLSFRFVEKGNLEVQLFILTSKLRANHQKMYTPPESKALSDINKVHAVYYLWLVYKHLLLNTVSGQHLPRHVIKKGQRQWTPQSWLAWWWIGKIWQPGTLHGWGSHDSNDTALLKTLY